MNSNHLTDPASLPAFGRTAGADTAVAQLQGRCSDRVCYAQTTTLSGERTYGHFSMETDALAAALGRQIPPTESESGDVAPLDLTLHRWLRDHDRIGETDEPATTLPSTWSGLEHLVEEVFAENHARVFCACCNRNVARHAIRLERSSRQSDGVNFRYFCHAGHLLLGLRTGQVIAAAEARAA
jgi:hypothetical protein